MGKDEIPLSVAKYRVLFFVPVGSSFSISPSLTSVFNLLVNTFVAIFSLEFLNSLNLDFLCKMISLKIRSVHLSPSI